MDFLELVRKRYSVRSFLEKEVEEEKIDKILEAGRLAPTACNKQPQRILVLNQKEELARIKKAGLKFDAPLVLIICYDKEESWKNPIDAKDSGREDASIITTHMMMEAVDLELGSVWVGYFDEQAVRKEFKISQKNEIVAILPIGYPAKDCMPNPRHFERKELDKTVFYHEF